MSNYFGKTFKKLRTIQNITLKKAIQDIDGLSPSRLSHWENEGGNIPLEKIDQLLYNIHVLPTEFANYSALRFNNPFTEKVDAAFKSNNISELLNLANNELEKYYQTLDEAELFLSALACNFYFQKTRKNILPSEAQNKIASILLKVKLWDQYYISTFGNTTDLLNSNLIYKIACKLTYNIDQAIEAGLETHIYAMVALLNANTHLLLTDPKLAQKLLNKIDKLELPIFDHYTGLRKKFLQHLINYRLFQNQKEF